MYNLARLLLILTLLVLGCTAAIVLSISGPHSGLVVVIFVVLVAGASRRDAKRWTTLGSARWANAKDLRQAGMLECDSGLMLGHLLGSARGRKAAAIAGLLRRDIGAKEALHELAAAFRDKRGPLVRIPKAIHIAIFIPSAGGKGVSFVVPFLLSCKESCVVVDFKGENAKLTAGHRRRVFGHKVILLDPYKLVTQSPDSFNPLDFIHKDDPEALDHCNDLAKALVVRSGEEKEPHWCDAAEMFIAAVIAVVVFFGNAEDGTRSLQTVRTILSDPKSLDAAIKVLLEPRLCGGILARMGTSLLHFVDKEKSSVLTTVGRHLRFLDSLAIADSTKNSSFDPALLRSGKMTVHLILPPDHMRAQSALLRVWIVSLQRAVIRGGLQEQQKTHFILDEAASLGRLEAIEDAVDKYRGYGVRLIFCYQSMGQLQTCFPNGGAQTLLSNCTQIFAGVNDHGQAGGAGTGDYVSARLGDETVAAKSGGTSVGRSRSWSSGGNQASNSESWSQNTSDNWQQQARRLLKPEEVAALPPRVAITFTPGVPPIRTSLLRYYEDPRLGIPPGNLKRAFDACRAVTLAASLFVMSLLLAGWVTQRLMEERTGQPRAAQQSYPQDLLRREQPDVPVDWQFVSPKEQDHGRYRKPAIRTIEGDRSRGRR